MDFEEFMMAMGSYVNRQGGNLGDNVMDAMYSECRYTYGKLFPHRALYHEKTVELLYHIGVFKAIREITSCDKLFEEVYDRSVKLEARLTKGFPEERKKLVARLHKALHDYWELYLMFNKKSREASYKYEQIAMHYYEALEKELTNIKLMSKNSV